MITPDSRKMVVKKLATTPARVLVFEHIAYCSGEPFRLDNNRILQSLIVSVVHDSP
jgi:hypothetical protein